MPPRVFLLVAILMAALAIAPASAQEVLRVVNGESITKDALVHRLLDLSTAGMSQLEEMVNETLLFQAAKKQGITASDAEVDARVAEIQKHYNTEDLFGTYLADQGVTKEGLRHKLRVKILVEKMLGDKVKVTDDEVRKAYDDNKVTFQAPETATLRIILTKSKERADEAMKRLDAGENFADVAKAISENAETAQQGGYLGRVTRERLSDPGLAEAVFATEVGRYTKPIQTAQGYVILKVEARSAALSQSFDDVKGLIRGRLQDVKLQAAWVDWLDEARKQATIDRKWQP
jgi:foldase protein PrsA